MGGEREQDRRALDACHFAHLSATAPARGDSTREGRKWIKTTTAIAMPEPLVKSLVKSRVAT